MCRQSVVSETAPVEIYTIWEWPWYTNSRQWNVPHCKTHDNILVSQKTACITMCYRVVQKLLCRRCNSHGRWAARHNVEIVNAGVVADDVPDWPTRKKRRQPIVFQRRNTNNGRQPGSVVFRILAQFSTWIGICIVSRRSRKIWSRSSCRAQHAKAEASNTYLEKKNSMLPCGFSCKFCDRFCPIYSHVHFTGDY